MAWDKLTGKKVRRQHPGLLPLRTAAPSGSNNQGCESAPLTGERGKSRKWRKLPFVFKRYWQKDEKWEENGFRQKSAALPIG